MILDEIDSDLQHWGLINGLWCTMGAKSIALRPPKVLNFEILELLTK
jgi:hypothetical protein